MNRKRIFDRLLRAGGNPPGFQEALNARRALLGDEPPARPVWKGDRTDRFLEQFEAAAGTWERLSSPDQIAERVGRYLNERGASTACIPDHPLLAATGWGTMRVDVSTALEGRRDWEAAVTVAAGGVAETGTLVLPAGPDTPASLNFLPEYALVVLPSGAIVDDLEAAWTLLGRPLPRTVNLVTGPSRTADVEQTVELGAHGPRALHVLLLED